MALISMKSINKILCLLNYGNHPMFPQTETPNGLCIARYVVWCGADTVSIRAYKSERTLSLYLNIE